ncbi:formyl transferase [Rhodopirellula baltica]|uniref:phosphoribosylglycinamide formyltransferase 1 n=1 Tax=Rhodopirellula baltica WH47 TaxID=991778 RepID=F2AZ00_RHOBT|nr:formyl transferase [Rhodopirellula baltica]EGF25109.1 formyl transferase domain-containing protein [Rhodopirellula baltica WH47]
MRHTDKTIVLLAGEGFSTRVVAAALRREFANVYVVIEEGRPTLKVLRSRIRMFGLLRGTGQILFRLVVPILRLLQAKRIRELEGEFDLTAEPVAAPVTRVSSANSKSARQLFAKLKPDVVVINGTRILREPILNSAPAFINMHLGITPAYRGVHGGYWAMVNHDESHFGTTIHFVDPGVDTGQVIEQSTTSTSPGDSFVTFPLRQLRVGVPMMIHAVDRYLTECNDAIVAKTSIPRVPPTSQQWFHPTLWGYVVNGVCTGVW